jgi:hypothetical protein
MPIYTYQTVESKRGKPRRTFTVYQSIVEPALTHDPKSGEAISRVITGGMNVRYKKASGGKQAPGECCPGCHE